jgi:hypothetical protein
VIHAVPARSWELTVAFNFVSGCSVLCVIFSLCPLLDFIFYCISMACMLEETEHRGQVVSTPALYSRGNGFKSWDQDRLSWLRAFMVFLSCQENAGIVPYIRPQPLPST